MERKLIVQLLCTDAQTLDKHLHDLSALTYVSKGIDMKFYLSSLFLPKRLNSDYPDVNWRIIQKTMSTA